MDIASAGIVSGLDVENIIQQLMALERRPIARLQQRAAQFQTKTGLIVTLRTDLLSLKSIAESLNTASAFTTLTASVTKTSSGNEVVSASITGSAKPGSYTLEVDQLAKPHKLIAQGWTDPNTTAIATGNGFFEFKVGSSGVKYSVAVNSSTTLEGLRDAINKLNAGVTATIVDDGSPTNPYRLLLTSDKTGTANQIIITQNDTQLDFSNKKIEEAYAFTSNSYTGTVNSGGTYTGTTNKTYLIKIVQGGTPDSGSAKYVYSTDGGKTWKGAGGVAYDGDVSNAVTIAADGTLQNIDGLTDSDTTTEGVKIKFTGGTLSTGDKFSIDVFAPELQAAQDAVIKVDNLTLTLSSNTVEDVIQGVTLELKKAESGSPVTLTISRDTGDVQSKIQDFVERYNEILKTINEQLVVDPDTPPEERPPLAGDVTLQDLRIRLQNIVSGTILGLDKSSYTNLSQIGITTNTDTGLLEVDESKLSSALSSDPDAVMKLFVATGTPSHSKIQYVGKTANTQAGKHSIIISTAPEQAVITGDQAIQSSGITNEEILTFKYSEDYDQPSPTYKVFNVTLSAGRTAAQIVDDLNSAFTKEGVDLVASQSGNVLTIKSKKYGKNIFLQVVSTQASSSAQTGIGTTPKSDTGVTVAGTINGHRAEGSGNELTSKSGFREDGLTIRTTVTEPGRYGYVQITLGVADQIASLLDGYVDLENGILKAKENSYDASVQDIEDQIQRIEARLQLKEQALRAQFNRLEVILQKYQTQSQYLESQLAQLSRNWLLGKK